MLRTLIVDDEAPARQRLERLLDPLVTAGRVALAGQAADGVEALERLEDAEDGDVDLLLLDIRMPEMSGFDLIAELPPEQRPHVIFATAYDRYALRAFEENAVDYLLKPIKQERLEEAVARVEHLREVKPGVSEERLEKLLDWVDAQQSARAERAADRSPDAERDEQQDAPATAEEGYAQQISVSFRDRIRLIPTEQVVTIEIQDGITRLFADESADDPDGEDLRQHVVDYTLDTLEASLDPATFMRVHRSAIVRLGCIEEMVPWRSGRYKLLMKGGHEVVASRDRSRQLRDRLVI